MNLSRTSFTWLGLVACSSPHPFLDGAPPTDATVFDIGPTPVGTPCGLGDNGEPIGSCSNGEHCLTSQQGYPNGYCAPDCLRTTCPAGSQCLSVSANLRYCVLDCQTNDDCRASEGYACLMSHPGAVPACLPNSEPLGRGPGGRACYSPGTDDGGAGPFMAPLPLVHFDGTATSASRDRIPMLVAESEPFLAIDPTARGGVVASFVGFLPLNSDVFWRGGLTRLGDDGAYQSTTVLRDHDFPDVMQVPIAFDRGGRLHAVMWSRNPDRPSNPMRYGYSDDGGTTFLPGMTMFGSQMFTGPAIFPDTICNDSCDSPAMAVGPANDGVHDNVYATAIRHLSDGSNSVVFAWSPADNANFSASTTLAELDVTLTDRRVPILASLAPGEGGGTVIATWVATSTLNGLSGLGDRANRVRLRISGDSGVTWNAPVDVSRPTDAPVALIPFTAVGRNVMHVAYVTGGLTGAWNVVLATSVGTGSQWSWRVVNDDDSCATHGFAGMAVDRTTGEAHVAWLDNRFGPGEVAYARCPADPTQRCSRNELVSGTPYIFTTSSDPSRWHGTHSSVVLAADGSPWIAWTDSRSGGPGIYVAHGRP